MESRGLISIALVMIGFLQGPSLGEVEGTEIGFDLPDFRGKRYCLEDFAEHPLLVVLFLGTECPLANLYGPRLVELADRYRSQGVAVIGVNSNRHDSMAEIAAYARRHGIPFPLLKDPGNHFADLLGAQRTPEAFVLDAQRRIRYRGCIDDQFGVGYVRERTTSSALRRAIDELLAGQPVSEPQTEAVGCLIGRVRPKASVPTVTYSNQIARIVQSHCVSCHRPGEIAPFSLTDYDEVAGWGETIAEVIREQRMPPWHASSDVGDFANARLLTAGEKDLVYRWVAEGTPEGDPQDLPEPLRFTEGWRLSREPDLIVSMRDRPFTVPAEETVEYQYFVADPGFTEDRWIHGAEIIPGNRSVVHHAIVFYRAPEGVEQRGIGWLTAYVPGQGSFEMEPFRARRVPAGSKLVFQMHYTPVGTQQEDTTRIGLLFADPAEVREELVTLAALNHDFEIPPFAKGFHVDAVCDGWPQGAKLLAIAPHMHVRGQSFRASVVMAGAGEKVTRRLLEVPRYDFNWQHAYQLREPLMLDQAAQIHCTGTFDNSTDNPVNPDPTIAVRWGDQTWEEMMIGFCEFAVPRVAAAELNRLRGVDDARVKQEASELIRRFDRDHDGVVRRHETPDAFAAFAFRRFDRNADDVITLDEAEWAAADRDRRKTGGNRL